MSSIGRFGDRIALPLLDFRGFLLAFRLVYLLPELLDISDVTFRDFLKNGC